jgi:hypothetical protein
VDTPPLGQDLRRGAPPPTHSRTPPITVSVSGLLGARESVLLGSDCTTDIRQISSWPAARGDSGVRCCPVTAAQNNDGTP